MAPLLGSKLDGTPLANTGRSLLLTVLGEFVLPSGGSAWTKTLTTTMSLLEVREKAARQAVARLSSRGWLEGTRIGRQTRWGLSDHGTNMLTEGAARIYGLGRQPRSWSGQWLVLLVSIPERDRNLRYRLGHELSWAGFGSFRPGTWISPWPGNESAIVAIMERLGVEAVTFRAELGQLGSGSELVGHAWDLDGLSNAYQQFLVDTKPLLKQRSEGSDAVAALAGLVHRWRRFPFLDPDLPAELMPKNWPGSAAVDRFSELREMLHKPATAWWEAVEAEHTSSSV